MRAAKGDRLHFQGKAVGMRDHTAVVLESRGLDGAPPYLVRHDDGHETVVFPGPDAWVELATALDATDVGMTDGSA